MLATVGSLLNEKRIDLDLPAGTETDAIQRVAALVRADPAVLSFQAFTAEILAREKISPTAIGQGVAFPHARTEHVNEIVLAAGRSRAGIPFAGGAQTVHLIFVIGTPNDRVREYLALVGGLARLLKDSTVREKLMQAATHAAFLAALR